MPSHEGETWKHVFSEVERWAEARSKTKLAPEYLAAIADLQSVIRLLKIEWNLKK